MKDGYLFFSLNPLESRKRKHTKIPKYKTHKKARAFLCLKSCIILKLLLSLLYKRKIITYGGYFERFISTLTDKELKKLDYIISLLEIEDKLPVKFIKFLRDGLYELRMEYSSNIYRVFFIFDEGQNSCPLQWISEEDTENTTIRN